MYDLGWGKNKINAAMLTQPPVLPETHAENYVIYASSTTALRLTGTKPSLCSHYVRSWHAFFLIVSLVFSWYVFSASISIFFFKPAHKHILHPDLHP